MPKTRCLKDSRSTIKSIVWGKKGVHAFPKCIRSKVSVIARLEFEPAYYDVAVQHVNHYATDPTNFEGGKEFQF